ncbi:uncharacterized protein E0L32_005492 [Thyridium curvatum]|uniref:Histone-lysine N-methyltransferase, H3 lysine-36 specific n=1 Tax=Thyridium curvatum TaxID=1093900 RepID=A0A507B5C4_9PEZI|nr:uncharacterized protein E0L32_005492 [Thyridium curvatum]TPX14296.1 hypothetical protein E0L32_005492 [Thyridium curvatum]
MEDGERTTGAAGSPSVGEKSAINGSRVKKERGSRSPSPSGSRHQSRSSSMSRGDVKPGSDSASTPGTTPAPKLTRKPSQREAGRAAPLFDHLTDVTEQSCQHFQVITDCLYGSKHMGSSEHDVLDCDCAEEYRDGRNYACGEDSDCINRATKMECVDGDCNCGRGCENQRFQRKQYADVSVIKTEKKGFGLRANSDLQANDFIFEYIGEVINEPTFRRRMMQYDDEGIKHFYFMSLTKHEFVDATKKGNLGRFCNHSCNPNCYVDKWVVGEKLRMGIFAGRNIKAGEELVFNYNVDRYGADPQPCYCGEPNCTGFIGGKTQTERATKLPLATIEALGIDDGDSWDTAVAKKPRKKKPTEDDEEYVNRVQPRGLAEDGVTKVMAALMQCKEKWIAVKLLSRIQQADDERVLHRVVRMHGYQILKTTLTTFRDDANVVLQILNVLYSFPRVTKNKISDSKIETTIEELASSDHEDIAAESKRLLQEWSTLETAYRIPRKKFDPTATPVASSFDSRRGAGREPEVVNKPPSPFHNVLIPKGPRSNMPQRNNRFFNQQRPRRSQNYGLPSGWFSATDQSGNTYYYTKSGTTTWQRPTAPADKPAATKGPSQAQQDKDAVQNIIDSLTRDPPLRKSKSQTQTPQAADTPVQEAKKEKWRSYPIEKQKKIYENTLFPSIKSITDRYRHKLPKEELKRFAKEVNKKLVESDYRHDRVSDPTQVTAKQEKKVKSYVKDFFDKAVKKHQEREGRRAERAVTEGSGAQAADATTTMDLDTPAKEGAEDVAMSDDENAASPASSDRKRKRADENDGEDASPTSLTPSEAPPSVKRLKEDDEAAPSPPSPPPPPPESARGAAIAEEQERMREQEEALMRENEEAQRLADEAEKRGEHNGEHGGGGGGGDPATNGVVAKKLGREQQHPAAVNGAVGAMDLDEELGRDQVRQHEVLGQ